MFGITVIFYYFILFFFIFSISLAIKFFKNKYNWKIYFTLISMILTLFILFFVWILYFPYDTIYKNSELKLSKNAEVTRVLSRSHEYDAYIYSDNKEYPFYEPMYTPYGFEAEIDGLARIENNWIVHIHGNYYEEQEKGKKLIVVSPEKIEYNLKEDEIKKRFNLKKIKFEKPQKYLDKLGENKTLIYNNNYYSGYPKEIENLSEEEIKKLPNDVYFKALEKEYQKKRILWFSGLWGIFIIQILYLIKKLKKNKKIKEGEWKGKNYQQGKKISKK